MVTEKGSGGISVECTIDSFWESLIGAEKYKGLYDEVSMTIAVCDLLACVASKI